MVNLENTLLSPIRRSKKLMSNIVHDADDDDINDDEEEKNRSRKRIEEDQSSRSVLDKSITSVMEHYKDCIQMSTENKINTKNAFSLQLIDYLGTLLKRNDPALQDFGAVGCTLDAGVKIYACRVDNVYDETMKMAGGLMKSMKGKKTDKEGGEGCDVDDEDDKRGPTTKKKLKTTLCTDYDQINRKLEGSSTMTNYMKGFNVENGIIASSVFDRKNVSLHVDVSRPFWCAEKSEKLDHESNTINIFIPTIKEDHYLCPSFRNLELDKSVNEISLEDIVRNRFDVGSILPLADDEQMKDEPLDNDMDCDFELDNVPDPTPLEPNAFGDFTGRSSVMEVTKMIASDYRQSEYFYYNAQALSAWTNRVVDAKNWNTVRSGRLNVDPNKQRHTRGNKKASIIDFTNAVCPNNKALLPTLMYTNWEKSKTVLTADTSININDFFRLSFWRSMYVKRSEKDNASKTIKSEVDGNDVFGDDQLSQMDLPADSPSYVDNDDGMAFVGDNLVEMVDKVEKIDLPAAVVEKVFNMKELKNTILIVLYDFINTFLPEDAKSDSEFAAVSFEDISSIIMSMRQYDGLSGEIFCSALLHVANEVNLEMMHDVDDSVKDDMMIVVDTERLKQVLGIIDGIKSI